MSPFSGLSYSENRQSTLFQNIGLQKPKHVADNKLLIKLCLDMFLCSFILSPQWICEFSKYEVLVSRKSHVNLLSANTPTI